jgi:glycosyltransferase involved in cell wall biosynthesis
MQEKLLAQGIDWHPLDYHKRPPVVSTLYDIFRGSLAATWLAKRSEAKVVHGRASVSSAIATLAAKLTGARLFVDADGPLSQEYVDAGVWREGSVGHRLTSWGERRALGSADAVAVLTEHRRQEVATWVGNKPVYVLPCAVDLQRFRPVPEQRAARRAELGLTGTVFVYAGKPGGWYDTEEMLAFLTVAKRDFEDLTLLLLSGEDPTPVAALCETAGVPFVTRSVPPREMPSYLSAADIGLCFLRPFPSKLSCSPIKLGEYLACGLPVVSTSGCGDYDELIRSESTGVVVPNSERRAYPAAVGELKALLGSPNLPDRCRHAASRWVGLHEVVSPRYAEIYRRLAPIDA